MCRGLNAPCPRRCVENAAARRARQNRHYALKQSRALPSTDEIPEPPQPDRDITAEQVGQAIERAKRALTAADPTYPFPDMPEAYRPGARFTESDPYKGGGWEFATEEGVSMEKAVREAGAAIAARAEVLIAERLSKVGSLPEVRGEDDDPYESAEEFKEVAELRLKNAERELSLCEKLRAEKVGVDEALDERLAAARISKSILERELGQIVQGKGAYDLAVARIRAQGYREALAEQRIMGPIHGRMEVHPSSSKKAVARLEQALENYPTDWIEADKRHQAHREDGGSRGLPLLVRDAKIRTRTDVHGYKEKYSERAYFHNVTRVEVEVPVEGEVRKVISDKVRVPRGGQVVREYWEWKMGSRWVETNTSEKDEYLRTKPGFRKRREVVIENGGTEKRDITASELVVDGEEDGCLDPGVSTAIHEYGHRAERVQPRVNDLMHAFIARRTTEDNVRAPLKPLPWSTRAHEIEKAGQTPRTSRDWDDIPKGTGDGKVEFTRSDGFADAYIGKQTGEFSSEAFTMGMEALFAGRSGGLVGDSGYRPDYEHRDLILGTLATV